VKRILGALWIAAKNFICFRLCRLFASGYADWWEPEGGMFVWIKLKGISDTTELIQKRALEKKVLLLPGSVFEVVEGTVSPYCRASYSFASKESMDEVRSSTFLLLQRYSTIMLKNFLKKVLGISKPHWFFFI